MFAPRDPKFRHIGRVSSFGPVLRKFTPRGGGVMPRTAPFRPSCPPSSNSSIFSRPEMKSRAFSHIRFRSRVPSAENLINCYVTGVTADKRTLARVGDCHGIERRLSSRIVLTVSQRNCATSLVINATEKWSFFEERSQPWPVSTPGAGNLCWSRGHISIVHFKKGCKH